MAEKDKVNTKVKEEDDETEDEILTPSNKKADFTKVYHVNKRASDKKWTIKFAGGERVIKLCDTKPEAIAYAKSLAEKQDGVVLVHASKGKQKGKIQKK